MHLESGLLADLAEAKFSIEEIDLKLITFFNESYSNNEKKPIVIGKKLCSFRLSMV